MKMNIWMRICVLALALSMTLSLFSCINDGVETEDTTTQAEETTTSVEETTDTEQTTVEQTTTGEQTSTAEQTTTGEETTTDEETTTGEETTTNEETTTDEETTTAVIYDDDIYANGGKVSGAGIDWEEDHFALSSTVIDESKAENISAAELIVKLQDKKALTGKEVYRLTDRLVLPSDKYYGNGAVIIADHGIVIENTDKVVIKGLVIKGSINVINSTDITLFEVDIRSESDALVVDANSSDISIKKCRLTAADTALKCDANIVSVFSSYFSGSTGMTLDGDDNAVQDCRVVAIEKGIVAKGLDLVVRDNTVEMSADGEVGVEILDGSQNVLVAMNVVKDVQKSILINGTYNCSVILNSAIRVIGENNTNLYVIDNNLGGRINLQNNNYLIADGNKFVKDQKNHSNIVSGNDNINGDTITDVDERADVGANEDILPHTNKELFVSMERNSLVTDISNVKSYGLNEYVRENAKGGNVVIVPPGVYTVNSTLDLTSAHSNSTIYAYGVLQECNSYVEAVRFETADDIALKGLSIAYTVQSCGQVHVLKKTDTFRKTIQVIPSAGYLNDFSKSGTGEFSSFLDIYAYDPVDGKAKMYNWTPDSHTGVVINDDGTMTITIKDTKTYNAIQPGDIFSCRVSNSGRSGNVVFMDTRNIKVTDMTLYSVSTRFAFTAETGYNEMTKGSVYGIELERVHNTGDSGKVIDKVTYDKYKALEEEIGAKLEVWQDEKGNYRGAAARVCSLDATHIFEANEGLKVTSCIFESMADDGTNHRGNSARLHDIKDNGDGTVTITYKNMMASWLFHNMNSVVGGVCKPFQQGQRVYIYTNEGEVVCDTEALSGTERIGSSVSCDIEGRKCSYNCYTVMVDADSVNWDALYYKDGKPRYDLSDNHYRSTNKVFVDNLSQNSAGFVFDNVLIQYVRSRGVLIKTVDATVKHCTFRDIASTAIKLSSELTWGESTVPRDATIYKCLFDHVGYDTHDFDEKVNAAISIFNEIGADKFNENGMCCKNVTIDGCKFTNNEQKYAIHIQNAQNVTITNCTFDPLHDEISAPGREQKGVAISLNKTMNINVENNTYNYVHTNDITQLIVSTESKNVYGSDVTDESGNKLIPDSVQ